MMGICQYHLEASLVIRASLVAQMVKNPPAMQETWVRSLVGKIPLEKGIATHPSILAWRIPWTEESGGQQSMGSQRVGYNWETNTFHFSTKQIWGWSLWEFIFWKMRQGIPTGISHVQLLPAQSLQLWLQFSSVAQSCPTLCDPMSCSTPGLPVQHQLPEFTQTHIHRVSDDIQPSHPLSSPSPPAPNLSQHQSLFQWISSSHEVAKVLEFQLQHHSI